MKRPSQRAAEAVVETAIDRVLAAEQSAREGKPVDIEAMRKASRYPQESPFAA